MYSTLTTMEPRIGSQHYRKTVTLNKNGSFTVFWQNISFYSENYISKDYLLKIDKSVTDRATYPIDFFHTAQYTDTRIILSDLF
jgi:hypothetical protein